MNPTLAHAPEDITERCPAIRDRHGFGTPTVQPTLTFAIVAGRTTARLYLFHGCPGREDWFTAGFAPVASGTLQWVQEILGQIAGDSEAWRGFPIYLES